MLSVAICLGNLPLQVKVAHIVQMPVNLGKQNVQEAAAPFCRYNVLTGTGTASPTLWMETGPRAGCRKWSSFCPYGVWCAAAWQKREETQYREVTAPWQRKSSLCAWRSSSWSSLSDQSMHSNCKSLLPLVYTIVLYGINKILFVNIYMHMQMTPYSFLYISRVFIPEFSL